MITRTININDDYVESSFDTVSEEFILHITENDIKEKWDGNVCIEATIIDDNNKKFDCWLRESTYLPTMEEYILYYSIYAEDLEK